MHFSRSGLWIAAAAAITPLRKMAGQIRPTCLVPRDSIMLWLVMMGINAEPPGSTEVALLGVRSQAVLWPQPVSFSGDS